jgi:hypothetical protein
MPLLCQKFIDMEKFEGKKSELAFNIHRTTLIYTQNKDMKRLK